MSDKTEVEWSALTRPFLASEIKERPGPGNRTLYYVDARIVASRLDEVLTPVGWQFHCNAIDGRDIVHGRLSIRTDTGWIEREDHGYPNSDRDEEPIKAATSDALKRCAVLFGIGRHLYDDNHSTTQARAGTPPPRRATPAPRPAATPLPAGDAPDEPPFPGDLPTILADPRDGFYGAQCPKHHTNWKEGQYGPFCSAKDPDGNARGYCVWKPSRRWIAEHELDAAVR